MVVVAIVGILSAVGLPELTKAQDRAKDNTAVATLTNAAKECSLSLISVGDDSEYTGGTADTPFENVSGDCDVDETLTLASETGNTATVTFVGSVPGVVSVTEAEADNEYRKHDGKYVHNGGAAAPVMNMAIAPAEAAARARNFGIAETAAVSAATYEGKLDILRTPLRKARKHKMRSVTCTHGSGKYVQSVTRAFV